MLKLKLQFFGHLIRVQFSSSLSHVWLFVTPWTAAQGFPVHTNSRSHPVIPSSVTPFSSCPHSFPVRVFSSELVLRIRQPKYWSFSFSISPSNEYSGLISFRIDWFDLVVQWTLKSLLQHHSSKVSILVLSFLYGPTLTSIHDYWKNHSFD